MHLFMSNSNEAILVFGYEAELGHTNEAFSLFGD